MDVDAIGGNLPLILAVIGFILVQFFLRRRRKPEVTHQEIARSLLSEVKLNQALLQASHLREKPKKFEAVNWQRNKTKLDFLEHSLQGTLSDAFHFVEDFNGQIDAAKKYKSSSYIVNLNADKLKEPLDKSQQGLEQWLLSTTGGKEPPTEYPGFIDSFFGGKR